MVCVIPYFSLDFYQNVLSAGSSTANTIDISVIVSNFQHKSQTTTIGAARLID